MEQTVNEESLPNLDVEVSGASLNAEINKKAVYPIHGSSRLVSLDILRGIAIFGVVYFHCGLFCFILPSSSNEENGYQDADATADHSVGAKTSLLQNVFTYFISWAGFFVLISGASHAYAHYGRFLQGKITLKKMVGSYYITGAFVLVFNYLYGFFTCPGIGSGGIITMWIKWGILYIPTSNVFFTSALVMIGCCTLISGAIFQWFGKMHLRSLDKQKLPLLGEANAPVKQNFILRNQKTFLMVFGFIALIGYPFLYNAFGRWLRWALAPGGVNIHWRNIVQIIFGSWMFGPQDPVFPYFFLCMIGSIIGLYLAEGKKKAALSFAYLSGLVLTVVGLAINLYLHLFDNFFNFPFETPPVFKLLLILGPMCLVFGAAIHLCDYTRPGLSRFMMKTTVWLRRFGQLSLTIFVMEAIVSHILRRIVIWTLGWKYLFSIKFVWLIMSPIDLIIWIFMLRFWEKACFKFSFEWVLVRIFGGSPKAAQRLKVYI